VGCGTLAACGLVILASVIRYGSHVEGLADYRSALKDARSIPWREPGTLLNPQQELLLGRYQNLSNGHIFHPRTSYLRYPFNKRPGVVRIGIFGASFVAGDEVAYGFDAPTLAQKMFRRNGYKNIEVINFGVCGYGMNEAFMLWKFLGGRYDLDYAAFLLSHSYVEVDASFKRYDHVHAKHIVRDGALTLLPPVGGSPAGKTRIYYRLLPPWRYLRYDSQAPMFIRIWKSSGRYSGVPANPFYKSGAALRREILFTYKLMFSEIAHSSARLILLPDSQLSGDVKTLLPRDGHARLLSQAALNFIGANPMIYQAPRNHPSATGNQLRAHELYAGLTGRDQTVPVVNIQASESAAGGGKSMPLARYTDLHIEIAGRHVAGFFFGESPQFVPGEAVDLRKDPISSFLLTPGNSGRLIPLPFLLRHNMELSLSFRVGGYPQKVVVGQIASSQGAWGTLRIGPGPWNGKTRDGIPWRIERMPDAWRNERLPDDDSPLRIRSAATVSGAVLAADGLGILQGKASGKTVAFKPMFEDFVYIRQGEGQFLDEDTLPEKGMAYLVASGPSGLKQRIPILSFHREFLRFHCSDSACQPAVLASPEKKKGQALAARGASKTL